MAAPIDLSNLPQDTCPLCRQRALTFSENTLRCGHCQSVAELDAQTNRIRYITVDSKFSHLEASLKQNWHSRRQIFELTTRPLPSVIFLPIILSLTALCVLLGGIAAMLAIRPSHMSSRNLISTAYSRTDTSTGSTPTTTISALMSPTGEITTTIEIATPDPQLTGTLVVSVVSIETPTIAPTPEVVATPPAVTPPATPIVDPTRNPDRPTALPTGTALPRTNTPVPTSATRVIALTPTTIGQSSPLATPTRAVITATGTVTLSITIVGATATLTATTVASTQTPTATPVGQIATPTATATNTPASPTETVIYSGTFPSGTIGRSVLLSNFIQISDIKIKGDSSFNEGDEYIDLLNPTTQNVNMSFWRMRINDVSVYYLPGNSAASQNFAIPAGQGCRIYTGNVNTQQVPAPYNWCGTQSFLVTIQTTGLYQNEHGTVEILDEVGKVVARFTY